MSEFAEIRAQFATIQRDLGKLEGPGEMVSEWRREQVADRERLGRAGNRQHYWAGGGTLLGVIVAMVGRWFIQH